MSELNLRASELIGVLHGILKCLEICPKEIGPKYARELRSLLSDLEYAVFINCSISEAKNALFPIQELMHNVNGAATKGEHDFFPIESDLLNHYWALETIFRESRYSKMNLKYDWQLDKS